RRRRRGGAAGGSGPAVSPTPRAALLLGALAPTMLVLPVWLVALGALAVVGAVAADALAVRRRIEVERRVPPILARGVAAPLGLGCWFQRPGEESTVLVYPDLPEARRLATAVRRGRFRLEGRARGPLGLGTEFESVRDYQPDDDIRQVNWRASQRMERPMS